MNLTEPQRTELARAIAESDIAGCSLENADIDALVDLLDAWLERSPALRRSTALIVASAAIAT